MATFLVVGGQYLRAPDWWLLVLLSFSGILLVSLRIVYLPLVLLSAVLLPLAACFWSPAWPQGLSPVLFLTLFSQLKLVASSPPQRTSGMRIMP
jgi:hypothetical protein